MDFKDWEKLSDDGKICTLRHPKGHVMKIAIKALPKIQQEAIKRLKMAKGGDVLESGEGGISAQGQGVRHANKLKQHGEHEEAAQEHKYNRDEAKGRALFEREFVKPKIKGLAEGGEVKDNRHLKGEDIAIHKRKTEGFWESEHGKQALAAANKESENVKNKVKHYDEGSPDTVQKDDSETEAAPQTAYHAPNITYNINPPAQGAQPPAAAPQQQAAPPQPEVPPAPAAQFAQAPVDVNTPQVPEGRPNLNPDGTMNPSAVAENAQSVPGSQAAISSELGKQKAQVDAGYLQGIGQLEQQRQQQAQEYVGHINAAAKSIQNGEISRDQVWKDMGGGEKIGTAIGLFLGGFSKPFGGQNYAMDYLNKQIDNALNVQKGNLENDKTVLGAYQHLYGDNLASTNAAKATMLDAASHKVDQINNLLATPQSDLQAKNLKQQIAVERNKAIIEGAGNINKTPGSHPSDAGVAPMVSKKPAGSGAAKYMAPRDPKWNDADLKPGLNTIPKTNGPSLVHLDLDRMKESQMLGAKGVPGEILPGEVSEANKAADMASSTNQAIKEIHKQFGQMWVNARGGDGLEKYFGKQHIFGLSAPDLSQVDDQSKRYYTAASAVKKQLANVIAGGGSQELYSLIEDQLPRLNDSPSDYREKLENIENILRQQLHGTVLKKYKMASGLPE